jgi:amidase
MPTFPEYDSFDGLGLAGLIQRRVISPAELLNAAVERIELYNPILNAVIHKMYDHAYSRIKNGIPAGIFQGVPFLLKDLIANYAESPLTMGSRFMQGYISSQDSEIVARYKKAGLIILGKTNVPEFGLGPVTEPELFGPTRNPWDITRTPGGSSGGSAAAVAARMVPMAHGNDGAGSIRTPAAYCGVFGFKPSRGRTPIGPRMLRLWLGMISEHVITRSVRDSAAMLDVTTGIELGSPISLSKPNYSYLDSLEKKIATLNIAITDQPFFSANISPAYSKALQESAQLCQQLGHQVESINIKINMDDVIHAWMIMMTAETRTELNALSRWTNKKIQLNELEKITAIIYRAGEMYSAADFSWAIHVFDQVSRQFAELHEKYDVLMTPTTPIAPPEIGYFKRDRAEQWIIDLMSRLPRGPWLKKFLQYGCENTFALIPFTPIFNITGQPAMSVPLFWDENDLPIGIQFVGRHRDDVTLFQLAKQLEDIKPWNHRQPKMIQDQYKKLKINTSQNVVAEYS